MPDPEKVAASLTKVQKLAIIGAVDFAGLGLSLTDRYEDHPDIVDNLSEDIADPVSGQLTLFGIQLREILKGNPDNGE